MMKALTMLATALGFLQLALATASSNVTVPPFDDTLLNLPLSVWNSTYYQYNLTDLANAALANVVQQKATAVYVALLAVSVVVWALGFVFLRYSCRPRRGDPA
eukprot:RCo035743